MFSCNKNNKFVYKLNTMYVDEIFNYRIPYFCQLFLMHRIHNNYYILLIYFLLKYKTDEKYEQFIELRNQCLKFTFVGIRPTNVFY